MNYTQRRLEEFDSEIKPMIENEVLCRYDNLELAQDSANIVNKEIRQFLSTSIAQAVAEEREMLRGEIEKIKTLVQKATGSFKYDSCYDDVISLLPTNTKREK